MVDPRSPVRRRPMANGLPLRQPAASLRGSLSCLRAEGLARQLRIAPAEDTVDTCGEKARACPLSEATVWLPTHWLVQ
eukprot:906037-Alexandrium_andersonii.AAC.1